MANQKLRPEIEKIHEIGKTVRCLFVCGLIFSGMYFIYKSVTTYWTLNQQPSWVTVVLAAIAALAGPTALAKIMWARITKFTKTKLQRLITVEKELDQKRLSSGLQEDGKNQPEDGI